MHRISLQPIPPRKLEEVGYVLCIFARGIEFYAILNSIQLVSNFLPTFRLFSINLFSINLHTVRTYANEKVQHAYMRDNRRKQGGCILKIYEKGFVSASLTRRARCVTSRPPALN